MTTELGADLPKLDLMVEKKERRAADLEKKILDACRGLNFIKYCIPPELLAGLSPNIKKWPLAIYERLLECAYQTGPMTDSSDIAACIRIAYRERDAEYLPAKLHSHDIMRACSLLLERRTHLQTMLSFGKHFPASGYAELADWIIQNAGTFDISTLTSVSSEQSDSYSPSPTRRQHPTAPPGSSGIYPARVPQYDGYRDAQSPTSYRIVNNPSTLPQDIIRDQDLQRRRIAELNTPKLARQIDFGPKIGQPDTPGAPRAVRHTADAAKAARALRTLRRMYSIDEDTRNWLNRLLQIAREAEQIGWDWKDFDNGPRSPTAGRNLKRTRSAVDDDDDDDDSHHHEGKRRLVST